MRRREEIRPLRVAASSSYCRDAVVVVVVVVEVLFCLLSVSFPSFSTRSSSPLRLTPRRREKCTPPKRNAFTQLRLFARTATLVLVRLLHHQVSGVLKGTVGRVGRTVKGGPPAGRREREGRTEGKVGRGRW
jgi:hypothetical protein